MMNDFAISELQRRLSNVVKVGVVSKVDPSTAKVRVKVGDLHSDWRPWTAGSKHQWSMPQVGESVILLSPSGETEKGIVVPSLYNENHAPPSNEPDSICWQLGAHQKFVIRVGESEIEMTADTITLTANDVVINE